MIPILDLGFKFDLNFVLDLKFHHDYDFKLTSPALAMRKISATNITSLMEVQNDFLRN